MENKVERERERKRLREIERASELMKVERDYHREKRDKKKVKIGRKGLKE